MVEPPERGTLVPRATPEAELQETLVVDRSARAAPEAELQEAPATLVVDRSARVWTDAAPWLKRAVGVAVIGRRLGPVQGRPGRRSIIVRRPLGRGDAWIGVAR